MKKKISTYLAKFFWWLSLVTVLLLIPSTMLAAAKPKLTEAETVSRSITEKSVQKALAKLDELTHDWLQKTKVPGLAIAVVYQNKVVYLKGFGVREAGNTARINPDTVFQIASMSKPIASTVIAGLVGDNIIQWDDPVIQYDSGFQLSEPYVTSQVTFRDLLSHRSGLPDHAGDDLEGIGFEREAILSKLRYLPIENHFRSQYAYTNFGITAAAVAAAKSTGKSWETLSFERLYKPLGMNNTSSRYQEFLSSQNRASGHVLSNNKWVAKYQRNPDAQSPAGGVSSSARDLAKWMQLQLKKGYFEGKSIIDSSALLETHRPQIIRSAPKNADKDLAHFYGLGWNVDYSDNNNILLSHSGAFFIGASTAVYLLPGEDLGIAIITNASPIGLPESLALSFLDLVKYEKVKNNYLYFLSTMFKKVTSPTYGTAVDYAKLPTNKTNAKSLKNYSGSYRNNYFGEIKVSSEDGQLFLHLGPHKKKYALAHYNGDIFTYQPEGEDAFGLSSVIFTMGVDDEGIRVLIENLNLLNQGTFTRVSSSDD